MSENGTNYANQEWNQDNMLEELQLGLEKCSKS